MAALCFVLLPPLIVVCSEAFLNPALSIPALPFHHHNLPRIQVLASSVQQGAINGDNGPESNETELLPGSDAWLIAIMNRTSCPPLKEQIKNIRRACTPVIGTNIAYTERPQWKGVVDWEDSNLIYFAFSNEMAVAVQWTNYSEPASIELLTKNEVGEMFEKWVDDPSWQRRYNNVGIDLDIIGATLKGVYLAGNELYVNTWTRLFFDLGEVGWLEVHTSSDVNGYEYCHELFRDKPEVDLIRVCRSF